jgi:hypothetical protein
MANRIVTNFCIGTEKDKKTISFITKAIAWEKYSDKVQKADLEAYIEKNFNNHALLAGLNSISNQTLVVYVDDEVAGYARVTTKGERPEIFDGKSIVQIADFGILKKFDETEARKSLFEKCLCLCGTQKTAWISEHEDNSDLDFFSDCGFQKNMSITGTNELGLPLVYLVKPL